MELVAIWDQVLAAVGLDKPNAAQTLTKTLQVALVVVLTLWIANRVNASIRRAARAGRLHAEVAALISRAAALGIFALGITVVLAVLGANWTAIAAILGAATFGISLALQDVGRSFVNGVYILVERPFRIGDLVRIGDAEGRVEEVGVRLTILRGLAGDRIIVPNTVVFSSIIEDSSIGRTDRQRYNMTNVERPVLDIEPAITAALLGAPHVSPRAPVVEILQSSPEGTNIRVTIEHDLGCRIDDHVIARLRERFPEATVATTPAVSPS